eukprot:7321251-Prymnesium_polylepis.2
MKSNQRLGRWSILRTELQDGDVAHRRANRSSLRHAAAPAAACTWPIPAESFREVRPRIWKVLPPFSALSNVSVCDTH